MKPTNTYQRMAQVFGKMKSSNARQIKQAKKENYFKNL
jgi:hypothetical protein